MPELEGFFAFRLRHWSLNRNRSVERSVMQKKLLFALGIAGLVLVSNAHGSPYASAVLSYNPGSGYDAGYTNTSTILGQPSTADSYGDAVDPFDSAWQTNQILSIGAGGWVTVAFDRPVVHYPEGNRDFIIFGNSFFEVPNYTNEFDLWVTDGAVASDSGQSTVSVSRDGVTFYALNPALAPTVDYLYPTDGSGDFRLPVNPALAPADFAGLTLAEMRLLYNGSAGGASYDIAWAQDTNGNPVCLPDIRYVRVDVATNRVQIAGFAAVAGTVLAGDFSNNPAGNGWQTFGTTNLFTWNATNDDLQVTWDSSQPNSYFYHPLGTILTSNDDFSLSFDLLLNDAGTNADGTNALELAIGFLNLAQAESTNFLRGSGYSVSNVVEFDFFPAVFGEDLPSLDMTMIDSDGHYFFGYADLPWNFGSFYHITINHAAGTSALTGQVLANGQLYTSFPGPYNEVTNDFRLDTAAIISYSDADSAGFGYGPSSILAHGIVKNFLVTGPPPPVTYLRGSLTNDTWQVQFWSRTNWNYTLEKSSDLQSWSPLAAAAGGTGGPMTLQDTTVPQQSQYYRVSATPQ
jgi:hypothetical protein